MERKRKGKETEGREQQRRKMGQTFLHVRQIQQRLDVNQALGLIGKIANQRRKSERETDATEIREKGRTQPSL